MADQIDIIANRRNPTKISNIVLDATLSIRHKYRNVKTNYTTEEGNDKTDHIRPLPDEVIITGHFSAHPIRILEGQFPVDGNRIDLAHTELLRLAGRRAPKQTGEPSYFVGNAEPIDIVCGLRIYTNMVITALDIDEVVRTRNALNFVMTCEDFDITQTQLAVVNNASDLNGRAPNAKDNAQKKVNGGVVNPQEVEEGSILYNWTKGLFDKTEQAQGELITNELQLLDDPL